MDALGVEGGDSGHEKERRGIQSIEAGGHLLLALGAQGRPMGLGELARVAEMAPGKAHPYLVSFAKLGLVTQEPTTGYYWLGPTAMQLGLVSLRTVNPVREATPSAEHLARETGHSVALAVWGNQGPTAVALFDAAYPLHTNIRSGMVLSVAGTATGRLFASHLPAQLIEESLLQDEVRIGPDMARPAASVDLQEMLNDVRKHGVSRAVDNPTPGVCAFSAPVFDYSGNMVLALTLMGCTRSFETEWDGTQAKAVRACGIAISRRLGALSR